MEMRPLRLDKKAQATIGFGDIPTIIMSLVMAGIFLGIGLFVMQEVRDSITNASTAYNATDDTITEIGNFSDWFGILVAIAVVAIIVGVLFAFRIGGAGGR